MPRQLLAAIALAFSAAAPLAAKPAAPRPSPTSVAAELLAADRAFAAAAATRSATDTLSAMITDDVVFYIVPVPNLARNRGDAIEVMRKAFGAEPVRLSWTAVRAGISADGSQGFTYGFMDRNVAGKPAAPGKYVAYWLRKPEGWRVAAFKLVPRAEGAVSKELRPPALPSRIVRSGSAARVARYRAEIDRAERAFSDDAQVTGLGAAFKKYGSADAMNVGGGADFTYGNVAIGEAQGGDAPAPSPLRWAPDGVIAAPSGDLGITYGYLERNGPVPEGRLARIPWITIWRREKPGRPWLYVAE